MTDFSLGAEERRKKVSFCAHVRWSGERVSSGANNQTKTVASIVRRLSAIGLTFNSSADRSVPAPKEEEEAGEIRNTCSKDFRKCCPCRRQEPGRESLPWLSWTRSRLLTLSSSCWRFWQTQVRGKLFISSPCQYINLALFFAKL